MVLCQKKMLSRKRIKYYKGILVKLTQSVSCCYWDIYFTLRIKKNAQVIALDNLKKELKSICNAYGLRAVLPEIPVLNFSFPANCCPECEEKLSSFKTKTKTVHTLSYGTVFAKGHIPFCPGCNVKYRSNELLDIVKPGRNYGYGCMVKAGLLRYIEKRQIDEVKNIFNEVYKIPISSAQVWKLSYEFLKKKTRLIFPRSQNN